MQLQTYSGNPLTEAFKAAEKAVDILGKGNFPLLPNGQHSKKNGKNDHFGYIPLPHVEPPPLTTSQGGDAMDLSASLSGPKCFKCGRFGHIATFCPKKTAATSTLPNGRQHNAKNYFYTITLQHDPGAPIAD